MECLIRDKDGMDDMFNQASVFNGDLSAWNVSSVTSMKWMFHASAFNDDISAWNVSSVTDMEYMFYGTSAFKQDLCTWSDNFPYNSASWIFSESGRTFQDPPNEEQGGLFCASLCSKPLPTNTCFDNRDKLKSAIDFYIAQDCAQN